MATVTHSTDLQWLLLRRNGKYFQLRNNIRMSSDPFNNSGRYTKKASGFIQAKAAVVRTKGNQLALTMKTGENLNQPKKMFVKSVLPVDSKPSAVSRAVKKVRRDLQDGCFRRAKRLSRILERTTKVRANRAQRTKARIEKKPFRSAAKREKKAK